MRGLCGAVCSRSCTQDEFLCSYCVWSAAGPLQLHSTAALTLVSVLLLLLLLLPVLQGDAHLERIPNVQQPWKWVAIPHRAMVALWDREHQ